MTVSVVLPTRGTDAGLIRGCLESLARQTFRAGEILVVDNGGGAAAGVCRDFEGARCVSEPRPGVPHARNRGVLEARGTLVAFVDDDVRPDPGWLAALVSAFDAPEVLAAGGPVRVEWGRRPGALARSPRVLAAMGMLDLGLSRHDVDPDAEFLVGGNLACRRSAVLGESGFRAVWPDGGLGAIADDYELSRRLARQGRAVYVPEASARHLVAPAKSRWTGLLARVTSAEAARTTLGGRLRPRRGPLALLGVEGLVTAAVLAGHFRARCAGRTDCSRVNA